jgi:hypothetical protein
MLRKLSESASIIKYLHLQSTQLCLASSKILTPTPLSTQRVCPPPHHRRGDTHSPRGGGGGVNIFEDARHWIGLLQYNLSTVLIIQGWQKRRLYNPSLNKIYIPGGHWEMKGLASTLLSWMKEIGHSDRTGPKSSQFLLSTGIQEENNLSFARCIVFKKIFFIFFSHLAESVLFFNVLSFCFDFA